MEVRYAPANVKIGHTIPAKGRQGRAKVIAVGIAVVVVRDKAGFTRTLLRKRRDQKQPTRRNER